MISPNLTTASEIATHIQHMLPNTHSGTLRFWGVWFGRRHDNQHKIVKAEAEEDCLIIHFNEEEILKVWNPKACKIDSGQFVIEMASRVLWQWYCYGQPHLPDNLMSEDFVRRGPEITFQSTFPSKQNARPDANEPAVQIH